MIMESSKEGKNHVEEFTVRMSGPTPPKWQARAGTQKVHPRAQTVRHHTNQFLRAIRGTNTRPEAFTVTYRKTDIVPAAVHIVQTGKEI